MKHHCVKGEDLENNDQKGISSGVYRMTESDKKEDRLFMISNYINNTDVESPDGERSIYTSILPTDSPTDNSTNERSNEQVPHNDKSNTKCIMEVLVCIEKDNTNTSLLSLSPKRVKTLRNLLPRELQLSRKFPSKPQAFYHHPLPMAYSRQNYQAIVIMTTFYKAPLMIVMDLYAIPRCIASKPLSIVPTLSFGVPISSVLIVCYHALVCVAAHLVLESFLCMAVDKIMCLFNVLMGISAKATHVHDCQRALIAAVVYIISPAKASSSSLCPSKLSLSSNCSQSSTHVWDDLPCRVCNSNRKAKQSQSKGTVPRASSSNRLCGALSHGQGSFSGRGGSSRPSGSGNGGSGGDDNGGDKDKKKPHRHSHKKRRKRKKKRRSKQQPLADTETARSSEDTKEREVKSCTIEEASDSDSTSDTEIEQPNIREPPHGYIEDGNRLEHDKKEAKRPSQNDWPSGGSVSSTVPTDSSVISTVQKLKRLHIHATAHSRKVKVHSAPAKTILKPLIARLPKIVIQRNRPRPSRLRTRRASMVTSGRSYASAVTGGVQLTSQTTDHLPEENAILLPNESHHDDVLPKLLPSEDSQPQTEEHISLSDIHPYEMVACPRESLPQAFQNFNEPIPHIMSPIELEDDPTIQPSIPDNDQNSHHNQAIAATSTDTYMHYAKGDPFSLPSLAPASPPPVGAISDDINISVPIPDQIVQVNALAQPPEQFPDIELDSEDEEIESENIPSLNAAQPQVPGVVNGVHLEVLGVQSDDDGAAGVLVGGAMMGGILTVGGAQLPYVNFVELEGVQPEADQPLTVVAAEESQIVEQQFDDETVFVLITYICYTEEYREHFEH